MNSKKIFLTILIIAAAVVFFVIKQDTLPLASPVSNSNQGVAGQNSPAPSISSYNPPAEVKYDSSTDLQKELDSIDPQVFDEDFSGL